MRKKFYSSSLGLTALAIFLKEDLNLKTTYKVDELKNSQGHLFQDGTVKGGRGRLYESPDQRSKFRPRSQLAVKPWSSHSYLTPWFFVYESQHLCLRVPKSRERALMLAKYTVR